MSISEQLQWFEELRDSQDFMAESNKIKFASELEKQISALNISQVELAKIIGVSPAYISKTLRGDANLTIETMTKFAHALGKCLHLYLADKEATLKWVVESFSSATPNVSYVSAIDLNRDGLPRPTNQSHPENSNVNWASLISEKNSVEQNNVC